MISITQKAVLFLGIAVYALLGFSPFAGIAHMAPMHMASAISGTDMNAAMHGDHTMHHEAVATTVSEGACVSSCIDSTAVINLDCLEHCIAAGSDSESRLGVLLLVSLAVAGAITATVQLFVFASTRLQKDRYIWRFRPLYIFNTVCLLE